MLKFCIVVLLVAVSAVTAFSVNKRVFTDDTIQQTNGTCSDVDPCVNGGTCVNGSCSCVLWTSGNRCEVVEKCAGPYTTFEVCGSVHEIICLVNETTNIPYCGCEFGNEIYDTELKKCRKQCGEDKHCKNGGKCVDNLCRCLPGTKDHYCEVIEGCALESDVFELCGTGLAKCRYNQTTHSPYCTCFLPEVYAYDALAGECIECNCGYKNPSCQFQEGKKICNCSSGYVQNDKGTCEGFCSDEYPCDNGGTCVNGSCSCVLWTSGDRCEVVEKCAGPYTTYAVCGYVPNLICLVNETTNIPYCGCEFGNEIYDTELKKCRKQCGEDKHCKNGGKCVDNLCRCLPGTKDNYCEVIEGCIVESDVFELCGTSLARCRYNQTTHRPYCTCFLPDEYAYDALARECIECKCGYNSHACQFQEGKKICNCSWGYVQSDKGTCEVAKCDCGTNGSCHFEGWNTVCDCNKGFVEVDGKCEEPTSSTDGSSIKTTTIGSKTDASSGVTDDSSSKTSNPTQSTAGPVSGATDETKTQPPPLRTTNNKSWRTGTIVLGILFAICLIGFGAVFWKLRYYRQQGGQ